MRRIYKVVSWAGTFSTILIEYPLKHDMFSAFCCAVQGKNDCSKCSLDFDCKADTECRICNKARFEDGRVQDGWCDDWRKGIRPKDEQTIIWV